MKCLLCDSKSIKTRSGKVRDNESIKILECDNCGFVYLDNQKHIKSDFYQNSGMHSENLISMADWLLETKNDDLRRFKMLYELIVEKNVLDFGTGTGGFLKMVSGVAKNAIGVELEKRVRDYWSNDLKIIESTKELSNIKFDLITAFHVIEHVKNPIDILKDLFSRLNENGLLVLEVPNIDDILISTFDNKEFKSFTYWSAHLYYFNQNTIKILCEKSGFKIEELKFEQRYPLSNHLYWLAEGLPGGHNVWSDLNSTELEKAYSEKLAKLGKTDTIIAFIRK